MFLEAGSASRCRGVLLVHENFGGTLKGWESFMPLDLKVDARDSSRSSSIAKHWMNRWKDSM